MLSLEFATQYNINNRANDGWTWDGSSLDTGATGGGDDGGDDGGDGGDDGGDSGGSVTYTKGTDYDSDPSTNNYLTRTVNLKMINTEITISGFTEFTLSSTELDARMSSTTGESGDVTLPAALLSNGNYVAMYHTDSNDYTRFHFNT